MTTESRSESGSARALWILIPTYDDWDALRLLLGALDNALFASQVEAHVLIVDDGSVAAPSKQGMSWRMLVNVEVLRLRRNLGHQRAIAMGLCHLIDTREGRGILVMDGDGEDAPEDISRLLAANERSQGDPTVFAGRLRRSEGPSFALFYHLYRLVHRVLTGVAVRMGNFSYIPWHHAARLVVCAELWSHYAAAIVHSRIPYTLIPCARAHRLTGRSKMNPVSLVVHGLSAMAVFADRIGVRALVVAGVSLATALFALVAVLIVKWRTTIAIPGWATMAVGLLVIFAGELILLSTAFAFLILSGRSQTSVIPLRDYRLFVADLSQL